MHVLDKSRYKNAETRVVDTAKVNLTFRVVKNKNKLHGFSDLRF